MAYNNIDDAPDESTNHISEEEINYPNLLTRVKALLIDVVIVVMIFTLSSYLLELAGEVPNWVRGLIFIFSIYMYEPIFITLFGGTIGHHVLGVCIKSVEDQNKKLNIIQASFRFLMKYLLGLISFITITSNTRKRAIHDITSGSIVLYK